jgi:tRNA nucleotidyltransferase (CCA-adding enzyme)
VNTDFDVATSATPDVVQRLFRHTVPLGERYGTIAVRTWSRYHEVTTFRRDVRTDGRHAVVEYGVSLDEDLARRDFTINAIAYHPLRHEWRDPFAGGADLDRQMVRAVGMPAERFREDYLRILRALRFAARFGFEIEPATWAAAAEAAPGLGRLSAERVREEWFKGLGTARSIRRLVDLWWAVGAARVWLPELVQSSEVPTGKLEHRAAALPELAGERGLRIPRDPILLTSLLCRDPVAVLARLKASKAEIARAAAIVAGPAEPEGITPVAVRRWLAAVGDAAEDLSAVWELRHGFPPLWTPVMQGIRERGEAVSRRDLAITGTDLQGVGIPPSPAMGHMLERLLMEVVDDPSLNTREALLARARQLQ